MRAAARWFGAATLALSLLSACATPAPAPPAATLPARDDLYVLMPAPDGKTGALAVTHGNTEKVLDSPFAAARIRQEGRLETGVASEPEIRQVFGEALAALPPRPVSFLLYFVEGKDELTAESRQTVRQVFEEIARRSAPEVLVIGHTDRVGSAASNDRLSLQRAARMRDELVKLGVAADSIQISGRGAREPLVPTGDQVAEPRNRRVEITVR